MKRGPTIKDLIESLQDIEQDREIILSSDAEGNGLHTLDSVELVGNKYVILWPSHGEVEIDE